MKSVNNTAEIHVEYRELLIGHHIETAKIYMGKEISELKEQLKNLKAREAILDEHFNVAHSMNL